MKKQIFIAVAALAGVGSLAIAQEQPAPPVATRMEIAGPVLMVTDLEQSLKFYVEGLGLEIGSRLAGKPGPGATITTDKQSPSPFLLLRQRADAPDTRPLTPGNGLSRIMLVADDPAATAARLKDAGFAPGELSARGIFFIEDPDGYRYEIMPRRTR